MHLQLYGDSKDRFKNAHTKASLSLQHFLGVQSGFTLDKESNTIAIICRDIIVVLAFDTRERLIQWQVKISNNLGEGMSITVFRYTYFIFCFKPLKHLQVLLCMLNSDLFNFL